MQISQRKKFRGLRQSSSVYTGATPVIEAKNHFEIGCTNLRNKQYDTALLAFVQASALDPDYPLLRDGMVSAFFHLGDRATALVLAEALVCSRPREANS
jgi:hypothetical protein